MLTAANFACRMTNNQRVPTWLGMATLFLFTWGPVPTNIADGRFLEKLLLGDIEQTVQLSTQAAKIISLQSREAMIKVYE